MRKIIKFTFLFLTLTILIGCSFLPTANPTAVPTEPSQPTDIPPTAKPTQTAQPTAEPTPSPTPEPQLPDLIVLYTNTEIEYSNDPGYKIHIDYPVLEGDVNYEDFNLDMNTILQEYKFTFIDVARANEDWRSENMPQLNNDYYISYEIINAKEGIVSLLMNISEYIVGAAHPNSFSHSVTYDLHTHNFIELSDLFAPDADHLTRLSEYCIDELLNQDAGWPEQGAGPSVSNFRNWNIMQEGLQITFDAYQVDAYAYGRHVVVIPFEELEDLLSEDSVVWRFED